MANNIDLSNLKTTMDGIGKSSVKFIKDMLARNDKFASGDLIKSINYELVNSPDGWTVNVLANDTFKYVDEGRRRGAKQPPTAPILKWIRRRGIKFDNMSDKAAAFVIARSISKKGIKALMITSKLNRYIRSNNFEYVKNSVNKDINKYLGG